MRNSVREDEAERMRWEVEAVGRRPGGVSALTCGHHVNVTAAHARRRRRIGEHRRPGRRKGVARSRRVGEMAASGSRVWPPRSSDLPTDTSGVWRH